MSEPFDVAISVALGNLLKTPDIQAPATTPIAWPMVTFAPVQGTPWLDVKPLLTAEPEHFGVATANSDILVGVFQVDAVYPNNGAGEDKPRRFAALVAARFPLSTRLPVNGRWLNVIAPPSIAAAISDAPWLRFPVSVRYQLIT